MAMPDRWVVWTLSTEESEFLRQELRESQYSERPESEIRFVEALRRRLLRAIRESAG